MKKRRLSEILWEAANKRLTDTYEPHAERKSPFSCNAIALAMSRGREYALHGWVRDFVRSLGCTGSASQMELVSRVSEEAALQGARYMWLLLAMHVAEDEGIEIEVQS